MKAIKNFIYALLRKYPENRISGMRIGAANAEPT